MKAKKESRIKKPGSPTNKRKEIYRAREINVEIAKSMKDEFEARGMKIKIKRLKKAGKIY